MLSGLDLGVNKSLDIELGCDGRRCGSTSHLQQAQDNCRKANAFHHDTPGCKLASGVLVTVSRLRFRSLGLRPQGQGVPLPAFAISIPL
jgi:hypothetical protein